jgi:hypothetical protein
VDTRPTSFHWKLAKPVIQLLVQHNVHGVSFEIRSGAFPSTSSTTLFAAPSTITSAASCEK